MNDATKKRLINNILKAINVNDTHLLTKSSIKWIVENYWLLHGQLHYLTALDNWHFQKDLLKECLKEFHNGFKNELVNHFLSDTDLNHAQGWIFTWFSKKQYGGTPEDLEMCYDNYRERIQIVNTIRTTLGFKTYRVKGITENYRGKIKKFKENVYARTPEEAISRFKVCRKPFKLKQLRVICDTANYQLSSQLPNDFIVRMTVT